MMNQITATLTPSCIPFTQGWLSDNGFEAQDPQALGCIIMQSLGNYVSQFGKYPFFHRHDGHLFIGMLASKKEQEPAELWLTAIRTASGEWIVGSPADFTISNEYHVERVVEEATALLLEMKQK